MGDNKAMKDYQNPYVFDINKVPPHDLSLDISRESAFSLNGQWDFRYYDNPGSLEADIVQAREGYTWDKITVPSVWELEGYGTPYYYANDYPSMIEKNPKKLPFVSESDNPTGVYRRTFTLTEAQQAGHTFIRFGGVKSAYHLYINGALVGYSQDSMTTSEFDITKHIKTGENDVMLIVYKFSDGTYLEDQDMWFMAGIFRDVCIYMEPETFIEDIYAHNTFDAGYTHGQLMVTLKVRGPLKDSHRVQVQLEGHGEHLLLEETVSASKVDLSAKVLNVKKWHAEEPNLYKLRVRLLDGDTLVEEKCLDFGFRVIEIRDGRFLINGVPILFKGVNRHDFSPDNAWAIDEKTRYEDLLIMKRHNINAVRCAHYPNPPHLYECCDRLGLYVIDEANLETHGLRHHLPKGEAMWKAAIIDRGQRMVNINKNHPSIVMWSLGNESGIGDNFIHMKASMKAIDSTRPFHYEGDSTLEVTDVLSTMYLTPRLEQMYGEGVDIKPTFFEQLLQFMFQRKNFKAEAYRDFPIMNCEYAHAMENSLGNFEEHIQMYEQYDHWIGGFIWDFVDQAIRQVDDKGQEKWLYGGDFGEENRDKYFCANGIIGADRSYHPAIYQVKHGYQYFSFDLQSDRLMIRNKYSFKDSSDYKFLARIKVNGAVVDTLTLEVPIIKANDSVTIKDKRLSLTYAMVHYMDNKDKNKDVIVEISAVDTFNRPWEKAGYEVAFDEFDLKRKTRTLTKPEAPGNPCTIKENRQRLAIKNNHVAIEIDKVKGRVTKIDYGHGNVLKAPVSLSFTRAEIDNDGSLALFNPVMKIFNDARTWRHYEQTLKVKNVTITTESDVTSVAMDYRMRGLKQARLTLSIMGDGKIRFDVTCLPKKDMVLFGLSMSVDSGYNQVAFYGRGPYENYIDRATGYKVGIYEGSVTDFTHTYMRPQENGNHTDVRWLRVGNGSDSLCFEALGHRLMECSVWPYTREELDEATHIHELPRHEKTTLNLNGAQRGVGGDLPGNGNILEPYKLKAGKHYQYGFVMSKE